MNALTPLASAAFSVAVAANAEGAAGEIAKTRKIKKDICHLAPDTKRDSERQIAAVFMGFFILLRFCIWVWPKANMAITDRLDMGAFSYDMRFPGTFRAIYRRFFHQRETPA